mmetsp:Transcript_12561/g.41413  ORF Transcript_12561/g.41413 Transcript_12561/m.41413 type:complete len:283 (-) Transcript_12561:253-1101(-)
MIRALAVLPKPFRDTRSPKVHVASSSTRHSLRTRDEGNFGGWCAAEMTLSVHSRWFGLPRGGGGGGCRAEGFCAEYLLLSPLLAPEVAELREVVEDCALPGPRLGGGEEHRREGVRVPTVLHERLLEGVDVGVVVDALPGLELAALVHLCEDDGEGHLARAEPVGALYVDLLRLHRRIHQQKNRQQRLPLCKVLFCECNPLVLDVLRSASEAVPGQVDEMPGLIGRDDAEVVDGLRLPRRLRYHREGFAAGDEVDEGRLARVRAPNNGELGKRLFRALQKGH